MQTILKKTADGTTRIEVTFPARQIAQVKDLALQQFGQRIRVRGFRAGKAPLHLVEQQVLPGALAEKTLEILVQQAYEQALKKYRLNPLVNPRVEIPTLKPKQDADASQPKSSPSLNWMREGLRLIIHTVTTPEVKLGAWQKALGELGSSSNKTGKVLTAQTLREAREKAGNEPTSADSPTDQTEFLEKIFDVLVETSRLSVADELVNQEIDARVLQQAQKVAQIGMRFEDYLKSQDDTLEDLRDRLQVEAERVVKLRFILPKVAQELGLNLRTNSDLEELLKRLKALATTS